MNYNDKQYYLRIEENNFGFVVDGIHDIVDSDISISETDYKTFFALQDGTCKFKIKAISTGSELFDYIDVIKIEDVNSPLPPSTEERISALEDLILGVL